jgi:cobalt/nickel transport system permease protein
VSCSTHFSGNTIVHRLDERGRIVVALLFTFMVASCSHYRVLVLGLCIAVLMVFMARIPSRALAKRLLRVNLFMVLLFVLMPTTIAGQTRFAFGPVCFSHEGLVLASQIALRANAIVLMFTALLGTVALSVLGHAFQRLRFPGKLVQLFMFTLRYLDVLHHEYVGLLRAMKARAFHARMSMHTYRSYGYLLAMLMVRSLDRAERIMDAMKCRGFKGQFHAYRHFSFCWRDRAFCLLSLFVCAVLSLFEWVSRAGGGV